MGRNGCGKTTFMSYLAQRQIEGAVPKKMTMLLVRQEIIGNEMSALETVIKSDVKREVSIEIELFLSNLCKITT